MTKMAASELGLAAEWLVALTAFVFPLEQLVAIPLGRASRLPVELTVLASVLGNSLALYCAVALGRWCQQKDWFIRLQHARHVQRSAAKLRKHGVWFAPLAAPFLGTWVTSLACTFLGLERKCWISLLQVSILFFAVLYGHLVYFFFE